MQLISFKACPNSHLQCWPQKLVKIYCCILKDLASGSSSSNSKNPTPIADCEVGALQYLAGYVVKKMLKKARDSKNYSSLENQSVIGILENAIAEDDTHQPIFFNFKVIYAYLCE